MFSQASVILFTGVVWQTPPGQTPPRADTPRGHTPPQADTHHGHTHTPPEMATAVDGTHATGMHSCFCCR